jgi:hypothetical protein
MRPWASVFVAALIAGTSAGCASPPAFIDTTPRFMKGATRVESLASYAAVRTPLADATAHVGFSWVARVKDVGPEGAVIEGQMTRVVAKLPGLITFDTDGLLPLGSLLPVGELLGKLVGAKFEYLVGTDGNVTITGWSEAVDLAARGAGMAVPTDGTVPDSAIVAEALRRVYGPLPRRQVALKEAWDHGADYRLVAVDGPKLRSRDTYRYEGFGELELEFGSDEVTVEGLGVPMKATTEVTAGGTMFLGTVAAQGGKRWGNMILNHVGDEVLAFHEAHEMQISPAPGVLPLDLVGLATLETGWVFFAPRGWGGSGR